jgi:hypothetical protein
MSSGRRTTNLGAVLLTLALAASACGGSKADATDEPGKTVSATTSVTPTPTPTPTPTLAPAAAPLSRFEGRPQVKTLRAWANAAARDLNARRRDFPTARRFEVDTAKVRSDVATSWHEDFDKYYPGPLPFTPISVSGSGRQAAVSTCDFSAGFSLRKPGGKPAEKREVIPVVFTMAEQGDTWLLAGIARGSADCAGVSVTGVRF